MKLCLRVELAAVSARHLLVAFAVEPSVRVELEDVAARHSLVAFAVELSVRVELEDVAAWHLLVAFAVKISVDVEVEDVEVSHPERVVERSGHARFEDVETSCLGDAVENFEGAETEEGAARSPEDAEYGTGAVKYFDGDEVEIAAAL